MKFYNVRRAWLCYLLATSKQVEKIKVLNQQLLCWSNNFIIFIHERIQSGKKEKNLSLLHSPCNRIKQQWSSSSSSYRNNKRKRITFIWTFGSLNNLNSWLKNDFKKVHSCSTASSSNTWIFVLIKWHVLLSIAFIQEFK